MIRKIDEFTITDAALDQMSGTPNQRLKEIMEIFVKHLHAAAREANLTPQEWLDGIAFLTEVGQKCTPYRQEFILLSDTLGLSALVNSLHDRRALDQDATKSSLLGPFYRQDSPKKALGDSIAANIEGHPLCLYGKVTDAAGTPIPNASIEVWGTDDEGAYDLQKQDVSMMDVRGHFHTNDKGEYWFRTVAPLGYMIPMDGPVGAMVLAQKRHGYRPAHIHFLIGAPECREVVTALYVAPDDHIESDTVFGVTESLVVEPKKNDANSPFPNIPSIKFDFSLSRAEAVGTGRVGADPSQITKASH